MPVSRRLPLQRLADRQIEREIAEMIFTQARSIPIRVVAHDRIVAAARRTAIRRLDRCIPVREEVVPVRAAPRDDVLRQVLVVDLGPIRVVVVAGQRSVTNRLYSLQGVHPCFLRAAALPLVSGGIDNRDECARARAELTAVEARERATRRVAAESLCDGRTDLLFGTR
jgi:hypothetical protein